MKYLHALLLDTLEHYVKRVVYSMQVTAGLTAGVLLWAIGNALEKLGLLGGEDE